MNKTAKPRMGEGEFIALTALMMSLSALAIDIVLPALPNITEAFDIAKGNDTQQVISLFFLGLTLGQLFYGPFADRTGRKPAFALGIAVFISGCLIASTASGFAALLVGRLVQGVGAAAMRVVAVTIVRDLYEGAEMARIMSFAMSVFITIPCLAPIVGNGIITVADWRIIFWVQLALAAMMSVWFWLRQPESLDPSKENSNSPRGLMRLLNAAKEVCTTPTSCGYMIASGLIMGSFMGYLLSSQQIFSEIYGAGDLFAVYFAMLAIWMGLACFLSGRIVMRYGMRQLCYHATIVVILINGISIPLFFTADIPLFGFLLVMSATIFPLGFLFGNMNAIALEPLGHIAGAASSVIGVISGLLSLVIGASIGWAFNQTVIPLFSGFFMSALAALFMIYWAESDRDRDRELL